MCVIVSCDGKGAKPEKAEMGKWANESKREEGARNKEKKAGTLRAEVIQSLFFAHENRDFARRPFREYNKIIGFGFQTLSN